MSMDRDSPCTGVMYVVAAIYTEEVLNAGNFNLVDVVDNFGTHYDPPGGGGAAFNATDQQLFTGASFDSRLLLTQSFARAYIPTDYHAGDTLTLTFNFPDPASVETVAMVFALAEGLNAADPQQVPPNPNYVIEIGNGDSYPDVSVNPLAINWAADGLGDPNPRDDCIAITAAAAHPGAAGCTFAEGASIGFLSGGDLSLGVGLALGLGATIDYEPGSVWPSNQASIVGNYQFIRLT